MNAAQPVFVPGRLSPRNVDRVRAVMRFLFGLFADVEVHGLEHIPPGGCLLCPNHLSRFDAGLVFCLLRGRNVTAFAADKYRPQPFFRAIVEMVDAIWVNRGAIGPSTIRAALQTLRDGRLLGLAPEGTRSATRALQPGKHGAALLAATAGVPIVPVAITGTEHMAEAIKRFRRARLTVTLGEPFPLPPLTGDQRAQKLDTYTDEIMCRIAALLPEPYRGVYADHPRLAELLRPVARPADPAT